MVSLSNHADFEAENAGQHPRQTLEGDALGEAQVPKRHNISLCRYGRVCAAKKDAGRNGVHSGLAAEADLCHVQRYPPGPRDRKTSTP
jgi:hypothetical protein